MGKCIKMESELTVSPSSVVGQSPMRSPTTALEAHGRIVAYASSCGVNNSPRFDTEFVVYRYSQTLLAAKIAFGGLHRDMPEKKLDLLEFPPRIMADARNPAPRINHYFLP